MCASSSTYKYSSGSRKVSVGRLLTRLRVGGSCNLSRAETIRTCPPRNKYYRAVVVAAAASGLVPNRYEHRAAVQNTLLRDTGGKTIHPECDRTIELAAYKTEPEAKGMRKRSLGSSLLKLMILIPLTMDSMVPSAAANGEPHHRVSRRIHLPRAVDASRKFLCKEPQSRAYNLKDLMQTVHRNPGESAIQPVYIVLKRCDGHSGCCMSPDMTCSPVLTAIYYEEIEIEIWSLETNGTRRQWIRVEQHGKCSCEVTTISDRYRLDHQLPNVTLIL